MNKQKILSKKNKLITKKIQRFQVGAPHSQLDR